MVSPRSAVTVYRVPQLSHLTIGGVLVQLEGTPFSGLFHDLREPSGSAAGSDLHRMNGLEGDVSAIPTICRIGSRNGILNVIRLRLVQ